MNNDQMSLNKVTNQYHKLEINKQNDKKQNELKGVCYTPADERDCDSSRRHECDLWMISGYNQVAADLSTDSPFISAWWGG